MKVLLLLSLLLNSTVLLAKEGEILRCLGEEEKEFHLRKESGPLYDLNQRLISELVQIPRVMLHPDDLRRICSGKDSASLKLLEHSIRKGKNLFILPKNLQGMEKAMRQGMIDDYVEASKEILLAFISQLQALAPTPTCLEEEIPGLKNFLIEVKYLQEDIDVKRLFKGKDQRLLERLKNYPLAFEKCRARLKKKASSPSTASPR